jgi:hypothetical protein
VALDSLFSLGNVNYVQPVPKAMMFSTLALVGVSCSCVSQYLSDDTNWNLKMGLSGQAKIQEIQDRNHVVS